MGIASACRRGRSMSTRAPRNKKECRALWRGWRHCRCQSCGEVAVGAIRSAPTQLLLMRPARMRLAPCCPQINSGWDAIGHEFPCVKRAPCKKGRVSSA